MSTISKQSVVSILMIMTGCVANNLVLEALIREDPGVGNLLTLLQFAFTAVFGFFLYFDFENKRFPKRNVPIKIYVLITLIFFSLSAVNNKAFDYDISQPIHMVFRSSSLLASLIMGYFMFGKRYTLGHAAGVIFITLGIIQLTFAEYNRKVQLSEASQKDLHDIGCVSCGKEGYPDNTEQKKPLGEGTSLYIWGIGICMLTVALLLSSLLGHIQDWSYSKYGKSWREGLFYTHLISLPWFVFFIDDIIHHSAVCSASEPLYVLKPLLLPAQQLIISASESQFSTLIRSIAVITLPKMWVYMILNIVTQIICIQGVYMLTDSAGALAMTATLTIRKFVSLVLSILYFRNPFTTQHWAGSSLVFIGGLVYIFGNRSTPSKPKKE